MNLHDARKLWISAVALVLFPVMNVSGEATDDALFGRMTRAEFRDLPDKDKRDLLVAALEQRNSLVRNLSARSQTHLYNVEYADEIQGDMIEDVSRYECELRRYNGRYWASIDWYLPDDMDRPNVSVVTTKDPLSGVARSVAEHGKVTGVYGAIDTTEDTMIRTGRLHYWFDDDFDRLEEFPLKHLLEFHDQIQFDDDSDKDSLVKVSLSNEYPARRFKDDRTLWLDVEKGFLPTRMERHWEYEPTRPGRTPLYSTIELNVIETREVDGVWFPWHIVERNVGRLSESEGWASIFETTVYDIQLGNVTDDDLQVEFAPGTYVHDRLKGEWSRNGVVEQATQEHAAAAMIGNRRIWWMIAGINLAFVGLLLLVYYRRRPKTTGDGSA